MTLTFITLHFPLTAMGDDITAADAQGYRTWIASELSKAYPGIEITVDDDEAAYAMEGQIVTDCPQEHDIQGWMDDAYNRCDWEWASTSSDPARERAL